GQSSIKVDVRVIAATNQDLARAVKESRFREDLYHRLNVVPVHVPSLSERREDIPELVSYFLKTMAEASGRPYRTIDQASLAAMQAYEWPGNVRQLRNIIERLLILSNTDESSPVTIDMLPADLRGQSRENSSTNAVTIMGAPLKEAREAFEREYLEVQIRRFSGNISRTAAFVGMERSALHRKIKTLGLVVTVKMKR
ncbi:MAG: sigma-54-dependent Fis family transcriptional regulator, partial [Sphingomonadales bacterium]|nr:sigma-54-dependent Fis family transcriptional regulator [Sphingomonadales bacterium]